MALGVPDALRVGASELDCVWLPVPDALAVRACERLCDADPVAVPEVV